MRRRLRPLVRTVRRWQARFAETTAGEAIAIYRSDAKPLGAGDSWRLARLLTGGDPTSRLVAIRPRALRREPILLRPGTSDAGVAIQTFVHGYHLAPFDLGSPQVVWDLGSNVGLTVAHYACLYPTARVVGVEPDPENAALASRNVEPWRERCTIVKCAVWDEDTDVAFERRRGQELASHVVDEQPVSATGSRVRARSLTTLLDGEASVDLLKVDIEGAERRVLRHNTGWAARVRHIVVEVHEPYTVDDCIEDLERLGFRTSVNPRFWVSVVGKKVDD